MMKWSRTLLLGGALILLTNAVVLGGAAYNRSAEPESQLRLSQRELQQNRWSQNKDNSGITLRLNWRIARYEDDDTGSAGGWGIPVWLDQVKMAELGFDVSQIAVDAGNLRRDDARSREVLLVLELNQRAYKHALQRAVEYAEQTRILMRVNPSKEEFQRRAKGAEERLKREQESNSRLFVVDAGLDQQKLRMAYPDRASYAIVHGLIHPRVHHSESKLRVEGAISEVDSEKITVPLEYRLVFEKDAPYEVVVAFGKRLEPWITGAYGTAAANSQ